MDYGIGRLGCILTGQDSFLKGLGTKLDKKKTRGLLVRASKWNVGYNPHSSYYSSLTFSFQSYKGSTLCSSDFGASFPFCQRAGKKRGLEKGNVCAWGGGELEASSHHWSDSLCTVVLSLILLVCVLGGRDSVLFPSEVTWFPQR